MSTALAILGEQSKELPAYLAESQDKGLGNENVTANDQQLPRIQLLQQLSPQLEEVEGAKAGLFFNTVTQELYTEFHAINLAFAKEYAVWRQRKKGGGYNGAFDTPDAAQAHIESLPGQPEDYDIQETAKHALLILDPETGKISQPAMMFLKSTGLNFSRNWNSQINNFNGDAPRFASIWTVGTSKQSNDSGTWYNPKILDNAWVPDEAMYESAKAFYNSIVGNM